MASLASAAVTSRALALYKDAPTAVAIVAAEELVYFLLRAGLSPSVNCNDFDCLVIVLEKCSIYQLFNGHSESLALDRENATREWLLRWGEGQREADIFFFRDRQRLLETIRSLQ